MTEPSDAAQRSEDVARLLLKAVRMLPEEEQDAVFEYFFEVGVIQRPVPLRAAAGMLRAVASPATTVFTAQSAGPNQQVIPVRLSEDSHRRLKQWCADHDFHMSVVVRGLVERFLDGWQEPGARGAAAGGA